MQSFRTKAYKRVTKTTPRPDAEAGPYDEPAAAADWAEQWLLDNGVPDESFVDLYFNGEPHIHTSIYLTLLNGEKLLGVLNSSHAKWPLVYMEGDGNLYEADEEPFGRDLNDWLPGDSDEEEGDSNDEDESDQDEEEEDGSDAEDDEDSDDDRGNPDAGQGADEGDEKDQDNEAPRLTIFGKFKGPRGWRKRAEVDPDRETNMFAVKFGVLDSDRRTAAQQERDVRVEVRFIERNSRRDAGELRIRIPDGVRMRDDGKWLVAEIPYTDEERED